jgi:DNA polymerase elongation subunit (family B)
MELLVDFREFDVPYSMRASIDLHLHCGSWYLVHPPESSGNEESSGNDSKGGGGGAAKKKVHPKSCSVEWLKVIKGFVL